jgi:superfamily I DNA/RNA helicase
MRMLEEERRNCYVALTRTKKKLFISYSKYRTTYNGQTRREKPSQF